MGFSQATRICLREKYATFHGRAPRSEYWWFYLPFIFTTIAMIELLDIVGYAYTFSGFQVPTWAVTCLILLGSIFLAMLTPMIAVTVRRFHDVNLSGWWYLGAFVAMQTPYTSYLAAIAAFVVTVLRGTEGDNKFGRDPFAPETSADIFS